GRAPLRRPRHPHVGGVARQGRAPAARAGARRVALALPARRDPRTRAGLEGAPRRPRTPTAGDDSPGDRGWAGRLCPSRRWGELLLPGFGTARGPPGGGARRDVPDGAGV